MIRAITEGDISALASLLRKLKATEKARPVHQNNELMAALCFAARTGNVECTKLLVAADVDWNKRSGSGNGPVLVAAMGGHRDVLEVLINAGADLNQASYSVISTCPLIRALAVDSDQHYECASLLLDRGADVNVATDQGFTPLMAACKVGRLSMIERLIKAGADLESFNSVANTAFMLACTEGRMDAVRCLMRHGAKIQVKNKEGMTALMFATRAGHFEVVKLLMEEGRANVGDLTKTNDSALMFVPSDCAEIANLLCERGVNVNQRNMNMETALMCILNRNAEMRVDLLDCLLKHQANVNLPDCHGQTPLMLAITSQRDEIVRRLIQAGAKVNISGPSGRTPLLLAAWHDRPNVIRMLADAEAKLDVKDSEGNSAVMLALKRHATMETFDLLLELGVDVNMQNLKQQTALLIVCSSTNTSDELVLKLLRAGANQALTDKTGSTALLLSVLHKNELACNALLKNGAHITSELHAAILNDMTNVAVRMLQAGALPRSQLLADIRVPLVFRRSPLSPLFTALLFRDSRLSQIFSSADFLNDFDMEVPHDLLISLLNRLESEGNEGCLSVARSVYTQPWSLWRLCFVNISTRIGLTSDRQQKLSRTGLPTSLQQKFMFKALTMATATV